MAKSLSGRRQGCVYKDVDKGPDKILGRIYSIAASPKVETPTKLLSTSNLDDSSCAEEINIDKAHITAVDTHQRHSLTPLCSNDAIL